MSEDKRTYPSSLPVAVNGLKPAQPQGASSKNAGEIQSRQINGNRIGTRPFSRDLVLRLIERIQEK
jgi:hypothetical protein